MKALLSHQPGGPDTLKLSDLPEPTPGPGELLVRVRAAAINFPDVLIIEDKYQLKPQRPFAPGGERPMGTWVVVAGDVVADDPELDTAVRPPHRGADDLDIYARLRAALRGEHAALRPRALEGLDLSVGPARRGGCRRTEHDQELRSGERGLDLFAEVGPGRQILLVAEDRRQPPRHNAVGGQPAGQRTGDAEPFELAVQPVGERLVLMAVAEEGVVTRPEARDT